MLTAKNERVGDVVIIKCAGRIVRGQEAVLRNAVLQEKLARMLVLDLTDVELVDAGGLNLLVFLRRWTEDNHTHLKLVNPRPFVREMLTRTHLSCVFDISSFHDVLSVICSEQRESVNAAAMAIA
ncbi:MAG TPA: STAS domain-containing protein [Terriglobales bacterium]|nr:STAS domain-containing protein [Terriglobales bacterium]